MVRIDRVAIWVIIVLLALQPVMHVLQFVDEVACLIFLMIALCDSVVHNSWRRYTLLWIVASVIIFYMGYSLFFKHYNTTGAIIKDSIIEIKSFIPLSVLFAIGGEFSRRDKSLIKIICVINVIYCSILLVAYSFGIREVLFYTLKHPAYCGIIIMASAIYYLYCSIDSNGKVPKQSIYAVTLFLVLGLLCGRSKYYGEFIIFLAFLYFYIPGFTHRISLKQILSLILISAIFIAAVWHKFQYYFLGSELFTIEDIVDNQAVARMALYGIAVIIIMEQGLLGSGLASFATFPSSEPYSSLYYEYGLNNVYGLSPRMPDFICDAYYASLAQFGVVGIVLFIWFWVYVYSYIKVLIRNSNHRYKYLFICASMCFITILIENTTGTFFTQYQGVALTALMGLICHKGTLIKNHSCETPKPLSIKQIQRI